MPQTARQSVGRKGEDVACAFLEKLGYRILARNLRVGWHGEVDILAEDRADDCLVFVEVKARTHADAQFLPETNLDHRKRTAIFAAARKWVALHDHDGGYRVDLVCVVGNRVTDHYLEIDAPGVRGRR